MSKTNLEVEDLFLRTHLGYNLVKTAFCSRSHWFTLVEIIVIASTIVCQIIVNHRMNFLMFATLLEGLETSGPKGTPLFLKNAAVLASSSIVLTLCLSLLR